MRGARLLADVGKHGGLQRADAQAPQVRVPQIGRGGPFEQRHQNSRVLHRTAKRADSIKAGAKRYGPFQRQAARGRLEPHQIVPRRGDAHGAAGIATDPGGGEPERDRGRRPRRRSPRHPGRVVTVGRRRRGWIDADAGKGQLRHMCLAQTDEAKGRGRRQYARIRHRRAALQQGRAGFGGDPGGIEKVFPRDRDAIQQRFPRTGTRAGGRRLGLGTGAIMGDAGIDAVAVFVGVDGVQKNLGQAHRIDPPGPDSAPQIRRAHPSPFVHDVIPRRCLEGSVSGAHGQSRCADHNPEYDI